MQRQHHLPRRIAAVILGTVVLSLLTAGVSVVWMVQALDRQAHESAEMQVGYARDGLLEQTRVLMLDYAKWEAAVPMVLAGDTAFLYDNIGASANAGISFQLAVLWGGPFAGDLGWVEGSQAEPRSGVVGPGVLDGIEARLRKIPLNLYRGTTFFAWHEGSLFAMAAARFEPDAPAAVADLVSRDVGTPRILIGRRVTDRMLATLGRDHLLRDLELVTRPPDDLHSLPLPGVDGAPVAYLAWDAPHLGSEMLRRMALPLLLVMLLTAALSAVGMIWVRHNAKQLVEAEHQASVAARMDPLTRLPNRLAFGEALAVPARAGERAVIFLDVNGFKRINDTIGHAAGDLVIREVARRLERLARADCLLARIAGDEFVFVLTCAQAERGAEWLTKAVARELQAPMNVLGHEFRVTVAMGYAVQQDHETPGDELVRQADLAMYEAKLRQTGEPVSFCERLKEASEQDLLIERGLRRALEQPGEFSIVYQPIVDPHGRLVRAEALARWLSPELGSVPPDRFIPVAEQAGLIVELGRVLQRRILDDLMARPDLMVSINVSTRELLAPDFVSGLTAELGSRGIHPSRIEIELTESVVVDNVKLAAEHLLELQRAGFSTALDDFGTGHASVSYLRRLGFDTLKIDRSFVSEIRKSKRGLDVVKAMILMAHGLDLRVVCEGVETEDELKLLSRLGCDFLQGYLIDRPLSVEALSERWLGRLDEQPVAA